MDNVKIDSIPKISKDRVLELYSRIKPVVRFYRGELSEDGRGKLYHIKKVNPFNIAFTWDPKPLKIARGLEKIIDIETLHTWGYYGIFKPSIEEVLAQIPREYIDRVSAFETQLVSLDPSVAIRGDYHVAMTSLYENIRRKNG